MFLLYGLHRCCLKLHLVRKDLLIDRSRDPTVSRTNWMLDAAEIRANASVNQTVVDVSVSEQVQWVTA